MHTKIHFSSNQFSKFGSRLWQT